MVRWVILELLLMKQSPASAPDQGILLSGSPAGLPPAARASAGLLASRREDRGRNGALCVRDGAYAPGAATMTAQISVITMRLMVCLGPTSPGET